MVASEAVVRVPGEEEEEREEVEAAEAEAGEGEEPLDQLLGVSMELVLPKSMTYLFADV